MSVLTFLLSVSLLTAGVGDKVGVTSVIPNEINRNFGKGHAGDNATYIQQLRNAVLPVSLINFDLKASNYAIKLEWKTASEKNSSHFVLKRSGDDKIFTDIARIQASGESSSIVHYQYIDRSPLTGYNYYQLEQVDADGTKILSQIITTSYNLKEQNVYTYFSEQGLLNMVINAPKQANPVKVTVSNMNGQVLASKNINIAEDSHYQFNDIFFNKGVYTISFSLKDEVITKKIIK
ncbi:T9SS type A sorting domain-containing protein [Pedobacter arcticus]|uniref:T9SS type A sorting domain-containing protein n=1 Tax=Pedobacter arcticus TaxID=752140 RepID=UPI0002FDCC0E|nr:T9SS type A sorting domain-containing protein [Pedobacter arcticus]